MTNQTNNTKTPETIRSVYAAYFYSAVESVARKHGDDAVHTVLSGGGAVETAYLCAEYAQVVMDVPPEAFSKLPTSIVCYQLIENLFAHVVEKFVFDHQRHAAEQTLPAGPDYRALNDFVDTLQKLNLHDVPFQSVADIIEAHIAGVEMESD